MSSPKWNGKKRFNPSRTFVMSDASPSRKYNLKSTFQPGSSYQVSANGEQIDGSALYSAPSAPGASAGADDASSAGGFEPPNSAGAPLEQRVFHPANVFVPGQAAGIPTANGEPAGKSAFSTPMSSRAAEPSADALEYASMYRAPLRPLQYNTYAPAPYRGRPLAPHERHAEDLGIPNDLRVELAQRNEATLQVLPASNLPEFVHVYHSLVPLDFGNGKKDKQLFGCTIRRFKAVSHTDGRTYVLVCATPYDVTPENERALQLVNKWKRVQNSSIVGVVEALTTLAFVPPPKSSAQPPQQTLVVVYEWWPLARPMTELHLRAAMKEQKTVWNISVQLFGALRAVHRRGLVLGELLSEQFVLFLGKPVRVRLSSLGLLDLLRPDLVNENSQIDDYKRLGVLLHQFADRTPPPLTSSSQSFSEFLSALESGDGMRAVELLTPHVFDATDNALATVDNLEEILSTELENARLMRLMAKLEYALTYPDDLSPTSSRYALTLFMQYVFHQQDEEGRPSLNLAHALAALNRLDAGTDENILLTSSDKKTRIIVSYKQLKQMFSAAFEQKRKVHT